MQWVKLGALLAVLAAIGLYIHRAESAKANAEILTVKLKDAQSNIDVLSVERNDLRQRVLRCNAEKIAAARREHDRVVAAQSAAAESAAQQERLARDLAAAKRRFAEELEHDPNLRLWRDLPVPDAVWRRVRSATDQTDH